MSAAPASIEMTLTTLVIAGVVGFGLFVLISEKGKALFPDDYGRKWLAWAVFASTLAALRKFFLFWDLNSFAVWLLALVVFGGIAYVIGLIIGLLMRNRGVSDEEIWSKALGEFEGEERHVGLWAKSLGNAQGDEKSAKSYYLRQRVKELLEQEKIILDEKEQQERIELEQKEKRRKSSFTFHVLSPIFKVFYLLVFIFVGYLLLLIIQ